MYLKVGLLDLLRALYSPKAKLKDMQLIDTHTHIHFDNYGLDSEEVLISANKANVAGLIAVACDLETSRAGLDFALTHQNVWSTVGVHPHEADQFLADSANERHLKDLLDNKISKLVAIGECGLDYFYDHSSKESQIKLLEMHLQLASEYAVPVSFHVRDAHSDFWPVLDNFRGVRGVLHSFSATKKELAEALKRELYIGLNGIMTFTKDESQLEAAKMVPKDKLLLETDAPYLSPKPFRGKICKPEYMVKTAEFLSDIRGEDIEALATYTGKNAKTLFGIEIENR